MTYESELLVTVMPTGKGRARSEIEYSGSFQEDGTLGLLGPSITTFDEAGNQLESIASGCMASYHFLRETPEALELLSSFDPVIAYHPEDVSRMYKTQAACEAAIAARPRVRLEAGRRDVAAAEPLRVIGGC